MKQPTLVMTKGPMPSKHHTPQSKKSPRHPVTAEQWLVETAKDSWGRGMACV